MTKEQEQQLIRDVSELKRFMENKKRQQISFPLDAASQNIINKI